MTHNQYFREVACGWKGRGVPAACCLDPRLADASDMTKRATASADDEAAGFRSFLGRSHF